MCYAFLVKKHLVGKRFHGDQDLRVLGSNSGLMFNYNFSQYSSELFNCIVVIQFSNTEKKGRVELIKIVHYLR